MTLPKIFFFFRWLPWESVLLPLQKFIFTFSCQWHKLSNNRNGISLPWTGCCIGNNSFFSVKWSFLWLSFLTVFQIGLVVFIGNFSETAKTKMDLAASNFLYFIFSNLQKYPWNTNGKSLHHCCLYWVNWWSSYGPY